MVVNVLNTDDRSNNHFLVTYLRLCQSKQTVVRRWTRVLSKKRMVGCGRTRRVAAFKGSLSSCDLYKLTMIIIIIINTTRGYSLNDYKALIN